MNKFKIEITFSISVPASFQRELADFLEALEIEGLEYNLVEIIETIVNKAPRTDTLTNPPKISTIYIQYREGE